MPRPPALAHIGVTVDDLDRAIRWYADVIGLRLIVGPVDVRADDEAIGEQAQDVFGSRFRHFRQAHMATANGAALELFEFIDPPTQRRPNAFAFWETGVFHICLVDPDIEQLVTSIEATGGRRRTAIWNVFPQAPYRMCYCEDPFGNIVEIYTHSHEQVFANPHGH